MLIRLRILDILRISGVPNTFITSLPPKAIFCVQGV
jgi:hypothetical protein